MLNARSLVGGAAMLGAALPIALAAPAAAQTHPPRLGDTTPVSGNQPVTFQADRVTYDREHALVTASGHVEAWQNGHLLRADTITFDRNTNVAAARGHVVLVEPDGQVLFANYAELTQGMREGVMSHMRAILAENGKLAGNGARRVDGKLNVLSRGVYSTCNLCVKDPLRPPLWQMRAYQITEDLEHKRIEYEDMWLDFAGVPVFWLPYFSNTDPSVHRQSGFMVPSIGASDKYLGTFVTVPYYYVIDGQSDVLLTPLFGTGEGPQLTADYRLDLNNGKIHAIGGVAEDEGSPAGYLQSTGIFDYNDTWRYGYDVNLASGTNYLRDFSIPGYGANELPSTVYAEGFGAGSYARVDALTYQALNSSVSQSLLPYVLPRYTYEFTGLPDALGGTFSASTEDYNVLRQLGTDDQRLAGTVRYDRPFDGALGERYQVTMEAFGAAYESTLLNLQPNFYTQSHAFSNQGDAQAAVKVNWPFVRDGGALGTQLLEPIGQVIEGANQGNPAKSLIPVEDSLDYEFTDATLFSLNRWGGYDRFDSGLRVNYGLHANWTFPSGAALDGLVGESWHDHNDHALDLAYTPYDGLGTHFSDVVGRLSFDPNPWLDFTARTRVDKTNADIHFADGVANLGNKLLRLNAGFFYGQDNPYFLLLPGEPEGYLTPGAFNPKNPFFAPFFTPREEVTGGFSTHWGHYSLSADARRDLQTGMMVSVGADGKYEDECFIFDINFQKRYTSINFDTGDTTILFSLTFKTVGQFGFHQS